MAPPGPPPYTIEEILKMTSPEERLRARAELTSYIARMKKEKQDRLANQARLPNVYPGYDAGPPTSFFRNTIDTVHTGNYNGYVYPSNGPQRGGYSRGRGGPSVYHPYQRLQNPHKFRNKSVTFNKQDLSSETLEDGQTAALIMSSTPKGQGDPQQTEFQTLCRAFTLTGVCTRHACRRIHDPEKQAVCKRWLFKGDCPKGDSCPLSHNPSSHNAPTCQHFQEGRCNNDNCRFSHVRINPGAPNCEGFGLMGYCEKGVDCAELHAHECPQFSNTGTCLYGDKCRLGHVRRASRMRKATRPSSEGQSPPSDSSKEDMDDTADAEIWIGGDENETGQNAHHFTQQVDFVSLNTDG